MKSSLSTFLKEERIKTELAIEALNARIDKYLERHGKLPKDLVAMHRELVKELS